MFFFSSRVTAVFAIASPQEPSQVHLDQSLYGAAFVLHLGTGFGNPATIRKKKLGCL
jgi:hypothetical protein